MVALTLIWLPGILILSVNGVFIGVILATLSSRFRDIPLVVQNIVQVGLFLTPIMWPPSALGKFEWLGKLNPLYYFIDVIRSPLLGQGIDLWSWPIICGITAINFFISLIFLGKYKNRIAYWV